MHGSLVPALAQPTTQGPTPVELADVATHIPIFASSIIWTAELNPIIHHLDSGTQSSPRRRHGRFTTGDVGEHSPPARAQIHHGPPRAEQQSRQPHPASTSSSIATPAATHQHKTNPNYTSIKLYIIHSLSPLLFTSCNYSSTKWYS